MNDFTIRRANAADAPLLGKAVVMAVSEPSQDTNPRRDDVWHNRMLHVFGSLAARNDSQYSFRNALVAVDNATGEVAGAAIGYDGARLHDLRRAFIDFMFDEYQIDLTPGLKDETDPGEFYIDTLAVFPKFRRCGIARALLQAMMERAREVGKPVGLLVDPVNAGGRALYESLGFKKVGQRPFFDEMMDHMLATTH